jgi:hypothetical protein
MKIQRSFAVLSVAAIVAFSCGAKSETGKPGRLGQTYDAAAYYKDLSEDPSTMPAAYKKNFESIKRAMSGKFTPVKHSKTVRIFEDDLKATLRVSWETLPVDGKHLILSASLEALDFSDGTSCTARDFKRQDSMDPFFHMVSVDIECSRMTGSSHLVINRSFYWNGAARINEPMVPNGELHAPGSGTEITD